MNIEITQTKKQRQKKIKSKLEIKLLIALPKVSVIVMYATNLLIIITKLQATRTLFI